MDLSAHPDDEDGSTLAYLRMKLGVRTHSVLFTRGEGGQNEKGPELYEKLGVLRSRETEEAGKILGAEVRFLNFLDFGYSKTSTETFQKWGGARVPSNEFCRALVRSCGRPITSTSANRAGQATPNNIEEIRKALPDDIDLFIDAGALPVSAPSTVVDVSTSPVRLVREGAVRWDTIVRTLRQDS
jgi:LmbE family N-acetylglucosaminyl deacetylase